MIILPVFAIFALRSGGDIGVLRANIERDARASQKISDDWQVAKQTTDLMSAMIFYSSDLRNNTFLGIPVGLPSVS